jgi:hypothetical protein
MWLLLVSLVLALVTAGSAYRALYADTFAYKGKHQGRFEYWRGEHNDTIEFVGVLVPTQMEL